MELFQDPLKTPLKGPVPLAERMRPRDLDEVLGQEPLTGAGGILRKLLETGQLVSMIFWGPPGSGKTTLARIIAQTTRSPYAAFSAVIAGIKEIREVIQKARTDRRSSGKATILFVDEIHRFNKAQQDAFLPHIEEGTIILIGATTENPSFEVISALLSRCKVFTLNPLPEEALRIILKRTLQDQERGLGKWEVSLDEETEALLVRHSGGDARVLLNLLEVAFLEEGGGKRAARVTPDLLKRILQRKVLLYDKSGEEHFNLISAFHKSLRGSDIQAGIYWLTRMLHGGEDPLYIARRMVRFASEDIGNADPQALQVALSAKDAYHFLGSPEGELALVQAAIYLAAAPKSNATYRALSRAQRTLEEKGAGPVPLHLRNAPTPLMREMGYGEEYKYPHDFPYHFVPQEYLPKGLEGEVFYSPTEYGFEKEIRKRMEFWASLAGWKGRNKGG